MTDGFRMVGFYFTDLVAFCLQFSCNLSANHRELFRGNWTVSSTGNRRQVIIMF